MRVIDHTLRLTMQSSVVFDTSALIWLTIGKNLHNLFHDLLAISRSVYIAEESFEKIYKWARNKSVSSNLEQRLISRKILGLQTEIRYFQISLNTSAKHEEIRNILKTKEIEIDDDELIIETLSLIAILSKQSKNILVISDNLVLYNAIDKLQDYYKTRVDYITSYEITLAYFSMCCIDTKEMDFFHQKYFQVKLKLKHYGLDEEIYNRVRVYSDPRIFRKTENKNKNHPLHNEPTLTELILNTKIDLNAYDTFLCYNNQDKKDVDELGEALKRKGVLPWDFSNDNIAGCRWEEALIKHISELKSAIIILGKHGIGEVQEEEIEKFIKRAEYERVCIIPLLLDRSIEIRNISPKLAQFDGVKYYKKSPDPIQKILRGICSTTKSAIFKD